MERIEGYRLSPQQRRLWRASEADGPNAYRAQAMLDVEGDLRVEALKLAVGRVVARHEILRTSFPVPAGRRLPLQVIGADACARWETADLRGAGPRERDAALEELWRAEGRRQFDPARPGLLRATLCAVGEKRHKLLLAVPALCADARSLRNVAEEVCREYAAALEGREAPPDPLQYADVSQWLNDLLESDDAEAGGEFWRGKYTPAWFDAALPTERAPEGGRGFDPEVLTVDADPGLARGLAGVVDGRGSPAPFLLSCWHVLLWRLGACPAETFVAVAHEGRTYEGLGEAVGLFVRHLPVGCAPQAGEPLGDVVGRVARADREAEEWQEHFDPEQLGAGEGEGRRFFPFGFDYEDRAAAAWRGAGVTFSLERLRACAERFKVKLSCVKEGGRLSTVWHYDGRLYGPDEIRRLAGRYLKLLEGALARPQTPVGDLPILGDEERHQLLVGWNRTASDYPRGASLHGLFMSRAAATPDAVAVDCGGAQLSYRALDRLSSRVAARLRRGGVGAGDLVGVLVERSAALAVALLGVLKAGAAYVPLDPRYPDERLALMIEDSGARAVLTQREWAGRVERLGASAVFSIEDEVVAGVAAGVGEAVEVSPDALAYVIYTSGSTGRPKGVMVTHGGLVNYLSWCIKAYRVAEGSGSPVHSSIGFDLTVTSLFPPLLTGRRVVLLPEGDEVGALAQALLSADTEFSLLKLTPAHLELLNELLPPPRSALPVKALVIGGEALRAETLDGWRDGAAGRLLVNEYGPTETVVGCIVYEAGAGAEAGRRAVVPIGRPIANTQAYVLDGRLHPVPVGTPGEIYIGGAGVARGYLGRPGATAEKFLPNPFTDLPGARMYRSGDVGRYMPDGDMEYLGRGDHQLKIRGFRIEPGEVEACLRGHECVREALVMAREDAPGDKRLVAYVVGAGARPADERELLAHVAGRLPEYMVPSRVVLMREFPLTVNGKVDRAALPAPEQARPAAREADRGRRTLVEELLAEIWCDVLKVGRADAGDDFFALGGHSLLAIRLTSRLRGVFGVELTLDNVFDTPTLGAMARRVETLMRDGQALETSRIARVGRGAGLPLSFAQQRLWFLDQLAPGSAAYNIALAVRLSGALSAAALAQSLGEVVRRHEPLRTTFAEVGGHPVQLIKDDAALPLPCVDLSAVTPDARHPEARRLAESEALRPFDLSAGPLARARLLRLSDGEHILLLTMHHIVSDGWSMGLLVEEVSALYGAYAGGTPSPLAELQVQYADYAAWQREHLRGEALERQLSYWREQLAGAPPALELPTDRPRPAVKTFDGDSLPFVLKPGLRDELQALARREGVTLFMLLLAAWQALLSRYTGQDDVCVGTPIANRGRAETQGLVGFFVNTLVLRADLSGSPTFAELLRRVREVCLGAYAHQDVPFETLVEELRPERSLHHSPLFQAGFGWENVRQDLLLSGGLKVEVLEVGRRTAKYDLTLALAEGAGGELTGEIEYNTDLFERETVRRMAGHYERLLERAVRGADEPVGRLDFMGEAERRRLLSEWNETRREFDAGLLIHQLFESRAEWTPDAVALVFGDAAMTYGELNARSNQLARYLRRLGVGPEVPSGLLVDRSFEMIVGVLGVLKAGGAYVPLDSRYPPERLRFMVENAGVRVLLTRGDLPDVLPGCDAPVVKLDADWPVIARESRANAEPNADPRNLAYVIYTSGSTGRPKGVMLAHRGLCNLVASQRRTVGVNARDRVLQFSSFSFDASVWEIFKALTQGAALCLAEPGRLSPGPDLAGLMREQAVTVATLPPSALSVTPAEDLPALRAVVAAGESCGAEIVARWAGGRSFFNGYGPTEGTVCATMQECAAPLSAHEPPIGRPVDNTQAYVLDARRQPVPAGVAGELCIGGEGLARGYLRLPSLTAERFTPHPFAAEPGARLYRTGDLARHLPDGRISFLGRIDHQVKVRGFRIEPGEVEAALERHEGVREAAVLAREDGAGGGSLVAYVVADPAQAPTRAGLRAWLRERLPEYMVPSAFVLLDELPLTPNGKLDRKALPAPGESRPEPTADFAAPRTAFEQTMAGVWSELLRVERVGLYDNFFELGGHSLLATRLVSRIEQALAVRLPLRTVFELPTLDEMTKAVVAARAAEEDPAEMALMFETLKGLSPEDVAMMLNAED